MIEFSILLIYTTPISLLHALPYTDVVAFAEAERPNIAVAIYSVFG